ncbi:DUF4232 domain-containing protein [Streptomyces sp. NPDC050617]|uniref:DUF4232 domain-containing protein n=1 Tax=Streptomyces sp. NPDC050617 TaxID=3154628 RepID=UPI003422A0A7
MSHRTVLRRGGRAAAVAALVAATAVGLAACDGGKSDSAGGSSSSSAAPDARASKNSAEADSVTRDAPAADKADADKADADKAPKGAGDKNSARAQHSAAAHGATTHAKSSGSGSGGGRCTTAELKAGWGAKPDMKSDQQQTASVWLKNTGTGDCTMSGFPGVQLKPAAGSAIDLPRSSRKPVPVNLKPGEDTSFTIRLLAEPLDSDQHTIKPSTVLVTPPNEKQHFQLKWPFGGAILDQSMATHPGTFVNPVNAG